MYSEIASNKRRSVVFIGLFVLAWLAIGAILGLLVRAITHHSADGQLSQTANTSWTPDHCWSADWCHFGPPWNSLLADCWNATRLADIGSVPGLTQPRTSR